MSDHNKRPKKPVEVKTPRKVAKRIAMLRKQIEDERK